MKLRLPHFHVCHTCKSCVNLTPRSCCNSSSSRPKATGRVGACSTRPDPERSGARWNMPCMGGWLFSVYTFSVVGGVWFQHWHCLVLVLLVLLIVLILGCYQYVHGKSRLISKSRRLSIYTPLRKHHATRRTDLDRIDHLDPNVQI